jgi:energy-coupling factor transporter ATP-binding protein EcfA2
MITRLFVNNFRCLDNFEIRFPPHAPAVILGKNGVGKSSIGDLLNMLHSIGTGETNVGKLLKENDPAKKDKPFSLEIDMDFSEKKLSYRLSLEHLDHPDAWRVREEALSCDGIEAYSRKLAAVKVFRNRDHKSEFSMNWFSVALPIIQENDAADAIATMKDALSSIVPLKPIPSLMVAESPKPEYHLNADASNYSSWLAGFMAESPHAYADMDTYLKQIFPDFDHFSYERIGPSSQRLWVTFQDGKQSASLPFSALSDGEKCQFLAASIIAKTEVACPVMCFWDEPDNYITTNEIAYLLPALCHAFSACGQFLATSHSREALLCFGENETYVLARKSHLESTMPPQTLEELRKAGKLTGSLNQALLDGEVQP